MTISKRPRYLTIDRITTIFCVGRGHKEWRAWLWSDPRGTKQVGETENIAIARVWWNEGLVSDEEARRMVGQA